MRPVVAGAAPTGSIDYYTETGRSTAAAERNQLMGNHDVSEGGGGVGGQVC